MFEELDTELFSWARDHHLSVATSYRDEEVRSIEIVDAAGNRAQIWLDPPTATSPTSFAIHAWDFKRRHIDRSATPSTLIAALDELHAEVQRWLSEASSRSS